MTLKGSFLLKGLCDSIILQEMPVLPKFLFNILQWKFLEYSAFISGTIASWPASSSIARLCLPETLLSLKLSQALLASEIILEAQYSLLRIEH